MAELAPKLAWNVTLADKENGLVAVNVTAAGAAAGPVGAAAGPYTFDASLVRGVPFAPWLRAGRYEDVNRAVRLRASDVVVATFPKSGTTLAEQAILAFQSGALAGTGALDAGDKNALGRRAAGGERVWAKVWPEACLCLPPDDDGSGERQRGAEFCALDAEAFDALPAPRLVKTHAPAGLVPGLAVAVAASAAGTITGATAGSGGMDEGGGSTGGGGGGGGGGSLPRIVVVVREPKDVATSAFYHAWSPAKRGWPFGAWAAAWASGATPSGSWAAWHRGWREFASSTAATGVAVGGGGESSGGVGESSGGVASSGKGKGEDASGGGRALSTARVLFVRYEDLASADDAVRRGALGRLGRFVLAEESRAVGEKGAAGEAAEAGAAGDSFEALVGRVDALCRFDAMKASAGGKGGHLRSGKAGDWRAHCDEADAAAIDATCRDEAAALGYSS